MTRSMTAYSRAHAETEAGLFLIEIHSVNRKSLDINLNLPKELLMLDMPLRQRLGEEVKRGYLTVRVTREDPKTPTAKVPNMDQIKQVHSEWQACASGLGYDEKEAVPFSFLLNYVLNMPSPQVAIGESFKNAFHEGFEKALVALMKMKTKEGEILMEDIKPRLSQIEGFLEKIVKLGSDAPKRFQDKLSKRLKELKLNHESDEERLARELVIFSDKVDVTEEITRLHSHLEQFRDILTLRKKRVGRELDFLVQEMNREVNTIAAKSQELEITQATLSVKSELEKIREQLQNIE